MLLEKLKTIAGYEELSELKHPSSLANRKMKSYLEVTPASTLDLDELNEVLAYMFGLPPESTSEVAKFVLMTSMR